jgi:glycosyltransferase involved in cell wall biosynthesis
MNDSPVQGWRPSICFVALNAYNILSGRNDLSHTGGAEVQQGRIASWLARRGYRAIFVTLDHGQPDGVMIDGIKIFKAYAKKDGIAGVRFVYPRWSSLWAAMARADADVYYHRGAECETGQVALWCRLHHRKLIFGVANESDCDSSLYAVDSWREKVLYRIGLRLADAVTSQTETQRRMLLENIGIDAMLVRNCGSTHANRMAYKQPSVDNLESIRILWVGRISEQKRLEWLLDIAEQCPEIIFDVVGAPNADSNYASRVIKRANGVSNIEMHGRVPYSGMGEYYRNCHVLCCTSAYEGFPNTFLEAWSLGVPVVTTFDPDGVVAANGLGWVAKGVGEIVACLRRISRSPQILTKASRAARQYYLTNHTPEVCLPAFERLLLQVAGCK